MLNTCLWKRYVCGNRVGKLPDRGMIVPLRRWILCGLLALLLVVPTNAAAFNCNKDGTQCSCDWGDQELVSFYFKYRKDDELLSLIMPLAYFRFLIPVEGETRRGISVRLHGDEFKPWPLELPLHSRHGPLISVGLMQMRSFEKILQRRVNSATKRKYTNPYPYGVADAEFGLKKPVFERHSRAWFTDDLFHAYGPDGELREIITCSNIDKVPTPVCRHVIASDLADLRISYARTNLPNWKAYSRKARKLIECALGRSLNQ